VTAYLQPSDYRDRLIAAARKVFSHKGLQGATTREIAREAGVNELTLFRHFHSKANLLAAVLHQTAENQSRVGVNMDAREGDLTSGLLAFAQAFNDMLESYEGLIRTLIGEVHRDPASALQVTDGAFEPWRQILAGYLLAKKEAGEILPSLVLPPVVDHFLGMLLSGMLRRTCPWAPQEYTADEYLRVSVDIFVRGISSEPCRDRKSCLS
jgi:AcrR family transcriptional regulator